MSHDTEYSVSWATLLYDFDKLDDIIKVCKELGLMGVISPIHNNDYFDNGEKKKDHIHILFIFKSKKSRNQVQFLTDKLGTVGQEHIYNTELYYRYLWHDEQTDKPIYNYNDLIFINCGESNFVNETTIFNNIIDIIYDEHIENMKKLISTIKNSYYFDAKIQKVLRNNQFIFNTLCKNNLEEKINRKQKEKELKENERN